MEGKILKGSPSLVFQKFNIDSRLTEPGELFFAIIAKRNGHDFIPSAADKGAAGAVISQMIPSPKKDLALVEVKNTVEALQKLAKGVLRDQKTQVVAITGSIGKTTTKEFTFSMLSPRFSVLKSEGNLNNHLGLALSLLKLRAEHEMAVLEMGASARGEIKLLTQIAPPDIAVITNVNPVHLEFFKNVEEIARAKKEILEGTKEGGIAILNFDDPLVREMGRDWKGQKVFFGFSPECDVQASNIQHRSFEGMDFELRYGWKSGRVRFPFLYESYLSNLLAAASVAYALSFPFELIMKQTSSLKPLPLRGTLIQLRKKIKVIDDSYNSNPKALEEALKGLSRLPSKRKVAVLGDMLELGEKEKEFHFQAGKQVVQWGWDLLITIGDLSLHTAEGAKSSGMRNDHIVSFANSEEAATNIESLIEEGDLILVKGSRAVKTERIVEKLKEKLEES
jgi:UDP-N-acetylmuramoyl-tripeptide--D-alanyl-D-alanine ligase